MACVAALVSDSEKLAADPIQRDRLEIYNSEWKAGNGLPASHTAGRKRGGSVGTGQSPSASPHFDED